MLQQLEPTATQVKEQKLYQGMGLTDEEFGLVESILGRALRHLLKNLQ